MSPVHEIKIEQLPREIADSLSAKDKAQMFNQGGAFLVDVGGDETSCTQLSFKEADALRRSCGDSAYKSLFVVPPASDPRSLREKRMAEYGDHDLENARHVKGRRG